jgi:hypothetical protein
MYISTHAMSYTFACLYNSSRPERVRTRPSCLHGGMGAPLWKRALLVALLAYNWAGLRGALRARGNGFLSPPGVGPRPQGNRTVVQPLESGRRLQFTADLHASSLMSSRSFLVRSQCPWPLVLTACFAAPALTVPACVRRATLRRAAGGCARGATWCVGEGTVRHSTRAHTPAYHRFHSRQDLPRMVDGQVAVQFLSGASPVPTVLAAASCWPPH